MKKVLFGIFAHPDDEAFGPCGTLIKEVSEGTELHLITLTSGEAGQNPDNVPDLGAVRDSEWRKSCKLIGTTSEHNLKLRDGRLNNIVMQYASEKVSDIVSQALISQDAIADAEFITFEPNGLTGHIDHIVAARLASFVFYRLKSSGVPLSKIRYYCNSEELAPMHNTDWIYSEKGHPDHEIDQTIDCRDFREAIITVMKIHKTQRADCEYYMSRQGDRIGVDHFIVRT